MPNTSVTQLINTDYKDYSKYVLYSRAIPSIVDGLKPSQRKILFTATKVANSSRIKTASLSGAVIEKANYHHGDASLNAAINTMTQDFNNNLPLLKGYGSFGSRLVPEPAAARYTFVQLSDNFDKFFIDSDILPTSADPEDPEPLHYLPSIPWVLVNGISGIAVGFATEIQPRSPSDLQFLCQKHLEGEDVSEYEIPPYVEGFKGKIERQSDGRWACYGNYKLQGTKLIIDEVPVGFDREKYVSHLDKLSDTGKIVGYKDICDKDGFKFEITLRRGAKFTDKQIIATFKLVKVLNENLTVINEKGELEVFNDVADIIKRFVDYRLKFYQKRYDYYIKRDAEKHVLVTERIMFINDVLDGKIVLKDKTKAALLAELTKKKYNFGEKLVAMPIYNFTKDELKKLETYRKTLDKAIKTWNNTDIVEAYKKDLK